MYNYTKIGLIAALLIVIGIFFYFDAQHYLTLAALKEEQLIFTQYQHEHPLLITAGFMVTYVVITGLSLPGATVLTLLAGALFGLVPGVVIASIASTLGATLSFFTTRFLLGHIIQNKYGERLKKINDGIAKEGAHYLFALRLVPIFPFFLVNIAMGLTTMHAFKYMVISWLGMLPGTIAYVFAGEELSKISTPSDILSFNLVMAFVVLGLLPLVLKKCLNYWREKRGKKAL